MQFTTNGLIVMEKNIGELDRLVTILTEEGLIRAFVRGAKSLKSKNLVATQLLAYSRLLLYKGRDKYIVNEADLIEMFFDLRNDITKLSLAQYFCELIIAVNPQLTESKDILRLILNGLYFLSKDKIQENLLKSIVEMRMMSICGYMPNIVGCIKCGTYEKREMNFFPEKGVICCLECSEGVSGNKIKINNSILSAIRHTIYSEFKKLFCFTISDNNIKKYNKLSEYYVKIKTERDLKTLDFYHKIYMS